MIPETQKCERPPIETPLRPDTSSAVLNKCSKELQDWGKQWRDYALSIEARLTTLEAQLAAQNKVLSVEGLKAEGLLKVGEKLISLEAERDQAREQVGNLPKHAASVV